MVCPDCGMSTWDRDFGCRLPGCENYGVLWVGEDPLANSNVTSTRD